MRIQIRLILELCVIERADATEVAVARPSFFFLVEPLAFGTRSRLRPNTFWFRLRRLCLLLFANLCDFLHSNLKYCPHGSCCFFWVHCLVPVVVKFRKELFFHFGCVRIQDCPTKENVLAARQ